VAGAGAVACTELEPKLFDPNGAAGGATADVCTDPEPNIGAGAEEAGALLLPNGFDEDGAGVDCPNGGGGTTPEEEPNNGTVVAAFPPSNSLFLPKLKIDWLEAGAAPSVENGGAKEGSLSGLLANEKGAGAGSDVGLLEISPPFSGFPAESPAENVLPPNSEGGRSDLVSTSSILRRFF
jgi:hypothetical protein